MPNGKDRFELVEQREVDRVRHLINPVIGRLNTYMNENHPELIFHKQYVGSVGRGVVSRVRGGNKGFDIDINLVIPYPGEGKRYDAKVVHTIFLNGIRQAVKGTGFSDPEESSSVFTLKHVDRSESRVEYGVDLAVIYYEPNGTMRFLEYNKRNGGFGFQSRGMPRDLRKIERIVKDRYSGDFIAESYIRNKNSNHDPDKYSFIIYAETIWDMYNQILFDVSYHVDNDDDERDDNDD